MSTATGPIEKASAAVKKLLHNLDEVVAVGSGLEHKASFCIQQQGVTKKNNAAGRPSTADAGG